MAAQLCECIRDDLAVYFKWVNCAIQYLWYRGCSQFLMRPFSPSSWACKKVPVRYARQLLVFYNLILEVTFCGSYNTRTKSTHAQKEWIVWCMAARSWVSLRSMPKGANHVICRLQVRNIRNHWIWDVLFFYVLVRKQSCYQTYFKIQRLQDHLSIKC